MFIQNNQQIDFMTLCKIIINLIEQSFLTRGIASPGETIKFPRVHKPLHALQHIKFDQINLTINTFVFTCYLKSGGLKQRTIT